MGTLHRYAFGTSLCLAPLLAAACGVVTPDEGGLFASAASAPDGGSGGGGAPAACGNGKIEAGEQCDEQSNTCQGCKAVSQGLANGASCDDPVEIKLTYGAGNNVFKGRGNTAGDDSPVVEPLCNENPKTTADGPDRVHAVTVTAPEGGYLTARLLRGDGLTAFDAVLYVREGACAGAATFCEDTFGQTVGGGREPLQGGDLLSFPVRPSPTPTTVFLFVDGVTADDQGPYELEVTFAKGTCDDPVPVFVDEGQPARLHVNSDVATPSMTHECSIQGTGDVIYKVTRSKAGVLVARLNSRVDGVALALLSETCDTTKVQQPELECSIGDDAFVGDTNWPDANRSLFVAVDVGSSIVERDIEILLDPNGELDF